MIVRPETPFNQDGQPAPAWERFLLSVYNACASVYESGTTEQRPTRVLWIGRRYWDTTLQIPIYYTGSVWKDAAGNVV